MASNEAKVRVKLDTKGAKTDLKGLAAEAAKGAGRIGAGIRSRVGRGMSMIGIGGLTVAGVAAGVGAAATSGVGDLASAVLRAGQAQGSRVTGDLDEFARASQRAADLVRQQYRITAGETQKFPPAAMSAFRHHQARFMKEELGASKIELNLTEETAKNLATKIGQTVAETMARMQIEAAASGHSMDKPFRVK